MNLHEYQAKSLFGRFGIPVTNGAVAHDPGEARDLASRIGPPVAIKAQVHTGGRGKAGGIRVASTLDEAERAAELILGMDIRGHTVRAVLVEPASTIRGELYLGVVLDRTARRPVVMASAEGGVDIEEVAARRPEAVLRESIEPLLGLQPFQARRLAGGLRLRGGLARAFTDVAGRLVSAYDELDATLAEINPLAVLDDGSLLALDGKMNLDDSGLYRHPDLAAMRDPGESTASENTARELGLSFVSLDGSIGCLVNGAGLAMATMDVIKLFGGEPANFLDIGGGAQAGKVEAAMRLLLADARVRSVLVNIFGGITRCDEVARGIVAALSGIETDVPFVVRLVGTNAAEGRAILSAARMRTARTLAEAAQMAVAEAGGRT